jgi:hypothetical protein
MTSSSLQTEGKTKKSLRKRLVSGLSKKKDALENEQPIPGGANATTTETPLLQKSDSAGDDRSDGRRNSRQSDISEEAKVGGAKGMKRRGEGLVRRIRSLSRSRSRSNSRKTKDDEERPRTIVTVTSCRSDGYYNQKAPGSTSKLPRKAPTNLKLFHELAVGIKDAYAAMGQTPFKPALENEETGEKMDQEEFDARSVLWEFVGNIDFVRKCHRMTT